MMARASTATETLSPPTSTLSLESPDATYRRFVNPEWARLLSLLGMNVTYRNDASAPKNSTPKTDASFLDFLFRLLTVSTT